MDLLSSAATKRDVKAYIARLNTTPSQSKNDGRSRPKSASSPENLSNHPEVNLGTFFGHARAVEQSPRFSQYKKDEDTPVSDKQEAHHVAIVKLVEPETIDDTALQGIGLTLSQLCRLSMTPCVVLDCGFPTTKLEASTRRQQVTRQAERLEKAIYQSSGVEARILDNLYTILDAASPPSVFSRKLLLAPIKSGQIPLILPLAYSDETQTITHITAHQAILALTRDFTGLNVHSLLDEDPASVTQRSAELRKQTLLDRLIILDPQGVFPV